MEVDNDGEERKWCWGDLQLIRDNLVLYSLLYFITMAISLMCFPLACLLWSSLRGIALLYLHGLFPLHGSDRFTKNGLGGQQNRMETFKSNYSYVVSFIM